LSLRCDLIYFLEAIAMHGSTTDMRLTVCKGRWKVEVDCIALGLGKIVARSMCRNREGEKRDHQVTAGVSRSR
jgi:hypothetical protein